MLCKNLFFNNPHKRLIGWLAWLLVLLSACTSPQGPLEITDISVSPDPVIGQTATLHVEIMSRRDEPDTTILIDLPPGVKLMKGDLTWEGSLTANQSQSYEVAICVLYEGDWKVWVYVGSERNDGPSPDDGETLHIITTDDSARAVRNKDYRITIPPGGMETFPTPLPEPPPTDICQ